MRWLRVSASRMGPGHAAAELPRSPARSTRREQNWPAPLQDYTAGGFRAIPPDHPLQVSQVYRRRSHERREHQAPAGVKPEVAHPIDQLVQSLIHGRGPTDVGLNARASFNAGVPLDLGGRIAIL